MDFRLTKNEVDRYEFTGKVPMELARKSWPDQYKATQAANAAGYDVFADGSTKPIEQPAAGPESTNETTDSTPGTPAGTPAADQDADGGSGSSTETKKKIQFTGKVRRGLALMRMVQMASMSDDCPSIPTFIERWSKAQQSDYNAALAWMEQEEDWDAVSEAWDRGRFGKRGGK